MHSCLHTVLAVLIVKAILSPLIKSTQVEANEDISISHMISAGVLFLSSAFQQIVLANLRKGWFTIYNLYEDISHYN